MYIPYNLAFFVLHPLVSSAALPNLHLPFTSRDHGPKPGPISQGYFNEIEELSRLVDVSYCVGHTGIQKPFKCLGRCSEFPDVELIKTWNTGPLLSDSCGYIALDHRKSDPRIILSFRGTHSIANAIADLSSIHQDYSPYLDDDENENKDSDSMRKCQNCTVHSGFYTAWTHTRDNIMSTVNDVLSSHPKYSLHLIGHSLGGAIATFGALDLSSRPHPHDERKLLKPIVTTFGEPRVGNQPFVDFVTAQFPTSEHRMRRVVHADDPVPFLPVTEMDFEPHGGEIFISKKELPIESGDVRVCDGIKDPKCSTGEDGAFELTDLIQTVAPENKDHEYDNDEAESPSGIPSIFDKESWGNFNVTQKLVDFGIDVDFEAVPTRLKLWQLLYAHRDYFHRMGLCMKGLQGQQYDEL